MEVCELASVVSNGFTGTLFKYGPKPCHLAFISAVPDARKSGATTSKFLVALGGMTEGFMYAPYLSKLAEATGNAGWTLVQAQLSSSYLGFGCTSLDEDADELHLIVKALAQQLHSVVQGASQPTISVVVLGHSTGSQITVRYLQRLANNKYDSLSGEVNVLGAVLQAGVSDREFFSLLGGVEATLKKARQMIDEGKGDQIVDRVACLSDTPVTAARMVSLGEHGGDDDMFSNDLTDEELEAILAPAGSVCPVLVLQSGADECVPSPECIPEQARRLAAALSKGGHPARDVVVVGARHNLEGAEMQGVEAVVEFLQQL